MCTETMPSFIGSFVNHDPKPLALHAANHPSTVLNLTNIELSPLEIVFQSPPCVLFARTASDPLTEKGARDVR
ncbi:hypothetical protein G6L86_02480 [Agrobacterium tumefaciens]|uniref:hypothetical protein n=1 Tax=Agrobacterium tumefaciens TaxID=358 RepID=UPI0015733ACE|nr:hypothetical protein [Agrobacterium tumefaciens]NSX84442.1 hypothetical protein [Agrobacterium tumefaciens]